LNDLPAMSIARWRFILTARTDSACGLLLAILLAAFVQSCGVFKELPTAPSDFSTGVIVYEHANYLGKSGHITADTPNLADFDDGPCEHYDSDDGKYFDWEYCISSVRVAPGWRATLYRGRNYHDDSIEITEDMPNLQLVSQHDCPHDGLNDCVSSLRVGRR
jgi:hypothetical protein